MKPILIVIGGRTWLNREAILGIAAYARQQTAWELVLVACDAGEPTPTPAEVGAAGAIVSLSGADVRLFDDCREPVVALQGRPATTSRPCVNVDSIAVGRLAGEYFLTRGYRSFGYVPSGKSLGDERRRAFAEVVATAGGRFDEPADGLRLRDRPRERVVGELVDWLGSLPKPTAVFACNDQHAAVVLQASRRGGWRVPEDIAVLGVHDDPQYRDLTSVSLSSIGLDCWQMGWRAAALLDQHLDEPTRPPEQVKLRPVGVVTRRSTDVFAVDDEAVKKALAWIQEQVNRPFNIGELVEAVGLSRSALERRFKAALGRTPHAEATRQRIALACRLLAETDLNIPEIGQKCGYAGREHFSATFKAQTGQSPGAFRRHRRWAGVDHIADIPKHDH